MNAEFCGMIGRAPVMQELFGLIRRLAPHVRTVLITGETGSGKELVARALHHVRPAKRQAVRRDQLLGVVVETLFESELFGHARGAFTGATDNKPDCSKSPTAERCSSTRSASCLRRCRPSCCACSKPAKCSASAQSAPVERRRARRCGDQSRSARRVRRRAGFAAICSTG